MSAILHGILAEFEGPEALLAAVRRARAEGFAAVDALTPFPVKGLGEALGHRDRKVQGTMLIAGLAGAALGFGMQTWATVFQNRFDIGGRPYFSWPAYIIITFEIAVLCSGVAGLIAILACNGLPRPHHPLFAVPGFERATRDRFFLLIAATDPRFAAARDFLRALGPVEVVDVPA